MGYFRLKIFVFLMVFAAMLVTLLPPVSSVFAKTTHLQHQHDHANCTHIDHHNTKNNSWSLIRDHKLSLHSITGQLRFVVPVIALLTGCMVTALTRLAGRCDRLSVFDSKPFPLPDRHVFNGVFLI